MARSALPRSAVCWSPRADSEERTVLAPRHGGSRGAVELLHQTNPAVRRVQHSQGAVQVARIFSNQHGDPAAVRAIGGGTAQRVVECSLKYQSSLPVVRSYPLMVAGNFSPGDARAA